MLLIKMMPGHPIKKESNIILIKSKTQRDFDIIGFQNKIQDVG